MRYVDWLGTLDDKKVRALASQAGVPGWGNAEVPKLRKRLIESKKGREIFEKNYGEETSVQNES